MSVPLQGARGDQGGKSSSGGGRHQHEREEKSAQRARLQGQQRVLPLRRLLPRANNEEEEGPLVSRVQEGQSSGRGVPRGRGVFMGREADNGLVLKRLSRNVTSPRGDQLRAQGPRQVWSWRGWHTQHFGQLHGPRDAGEEAGCSASEGGRLDIHLVLRGQRLDPLHPCQEPARLPRLLRRWQSRIHDNGNQEQRRD